MRETPDICLLSATGMSRLLRARKLSAREVLAAHLEQIERVNPKVNAIVTLAAERACAEARACDEDAAHGRFRGPLHGLPVAHKDLEETRGMRTTFGSPIFRDYVPGFDTLLVERIRAAGAIAIGKTNTPEFGAGSQTFNPVFGATRNPYDVTKTCGGSSGGAATALACRMTPLADGSDTGGSLRNPASFCSVVGMRPSPGRVPRVPSPMPFSPLTVAGPLARTVEDAALLLSAMAGPDPRAPLSLPAVDFTRPLDRKWEGVRIAWCPRFAGLPFDPRVREVFESRRCAFEALGCIVEEDEPDLAGADSIFRVFRALEFYTLHAGKLAQHRELIKSTVVEEIERGARLTAAEIAAAEIERAQLIARVARFMERFEYFVLPAVQTPPFDVDQPFVTEIDGVRMSSYIDWMRSCYYVTVAALPAISVPAGFTRDGLPVGLQIAGRAQQDFGVLQIAHAFEQAAGPMQRLPVI